MSIINTAKRIYHWWPFSLFRQGMKLVYRRQILYPLNKKEYRKLEKYKDAHKGERCFIIATAPSLTLEDVNKVKREITFSMNSCFKIFDKTEWRPNYYCIADASVYERVKDELENIKCNKIFISEHINWRGKNIYKLPIQMNWANNTVERSHLSQKYKEEKFSDDITKICYMGSSVVHVILQICFYMGFGEIYLLGADCDFSGAIKHSKLMGYKGSNNLTNSPEDMYNGLMRNYALAKKLAEEKGIKIFNATRGGKLELFPRVNLEDLKFLS